MKAIFIIVSNNWSKWKWKYTDLDIEVERRIQHSIKGNWLKCMYTVLKKMIKADAWANLQLCCCLTEST